jgi:prevent-host-death family protein
MIMVINANEVKQNGVSLFGKLLSKVDELIISVRGKEKYVVLDIDRYKEFREYELDLAHMKAMDDIKNGRYKVQSAKEHIEELRSVL